MKMLYFIKTFAPFVFLPLAPGMVQVELEQRGPSAHVGGFLFPFLLQFLFTVSLIVWLAYVLHRKNQKKEFLRMSCISKQVFHQGKWMTVEAYLAAFHNIVVSHGMTPEETQAWVSESERWLDEELKASASVHAPKTAAETESLLATE